MGKQKRKLKKPKKPDVELTEYDRLEIAELSFVERLELFERALEHQAKRGIITPQQYQEQLESISKWIAESMEH